jgi:hypothetical protein
VAITTTIIEAGAGVLAARARSATRPEVLSHALDVRANALEHGIDLAARPADVLAVARRPWEGGAIRGLDQADTTRLRSLVATAIEGEPIRIQTVMTAEEATWLLGGDGTRRMRTVYDAIGAGVDELFFDATRLEEGATGRALREQKLGLLGTGTTIYGRVRIGEVAHTPMVDPGAARTMRYRAPHLSLGPGQYGDVSLTLREATLDRATFTPRDTGQVGFTRDVGAREQLADVLADTIASHFKVAERRVASTNHPFGVDGEGEFRAHADLYRAFRHLIDAPDSHAVEGIRQHLRSAAMDTYYAEAQVRVATAADVEHVSAKAIRRIDPASIPADTPKAALDAYARRIATREELPSLAASRGIAFHAADGPLPPRA